MMHLPHDYRHGVWDYYWLLGSEFYRCKPRHVVIFVDLAGKSWMNFPAEATAKVKKQGFDMIKKKIVNPQKVRRIDGGLNGLRLARPGIRQTQQERNAHLAFMERRSLVEDSVLAQHVAVV